MLDRREDDEADPIIFDEHNFQNDSVSDIQWNWIIFLLDTILFCLSIAVTNGLFEREATKSISRGSRLATSRSFVIVFNSAPHPVWSLFCCTFNTTEYALKNSGEQQGTKSWAMCFQGQMGSMRGQSGNDWLHSDVTNFLLMRVKCEYKCAN